MPAIYPENKSYGTTGTKPLSIAEFQNSIKQIRNRAAQAATTPKKLNSYSEYAPSTPTQPSPITPNFELNKTLVPETSGMSFPIESYPSSTPIENPVGPGTTIKNISGMGQFVSDPNKPDKVTKWFANTDRSSNETENSLIRAGYDPKYYELDHELPIALGGADTLGNKMILAKPDHEVKSRIQQVAIQLQQSGKISKTEAQRMALNWETYKPWIDQIPTGYNGDKWIGITTEQAQKAYNEMQKAPALSWKSFKEAIPDAPKTIKNPFVREAFKGAVSQIPLLDFALPEVRKYSETDKYATPEEDNAAKFGKFAGMIFGGVAAFGAVGKLLGWGGKALGLAGKGLGLVNEAKQAETVLEAAKAGKALQSVTEGAGIKTLDEASKLAGLIGKGSPIAKLASAEMMKNQLKAGGINAVLGQLYRQDEEGITNRMKKAAGDFAMGTFIGGDPAKVSSYVKTMGYATTISMMMGEDIQTALTNGATITALHGISGLAPIVTMGFKGPAETEFGNKHMNLARQVAESTGNIPAREMTLKEKYNTGRMTKEGNVELQTKLNQQNIEDSLSKAQIGLAKQTRGELFGKGYDPKTTGSNADLLDQENRILFRKLADKAAAENWPLEKIQTEMKKVMMSGRVLYKQGLSPEARLKADIEDLWTVRQKVKEGKITVDNKPENAMNTDVAVSVAPEIVDRGRRVTLADWEPTGDDFYAPGMGMGKDVKRGDVSGIDTNLKNAKEVTDFARIFPENNAVRLVSEDEAASSPRFSKYKKYKNAVVAEVRIVKENNLEKVLREQDAARAQRIESGHPIKGDLESTPHAHPETSQGIYVDLPYRDANGKVQVKSVRIGSTNRKSNYLKDEAIDMGNGPEKEFDFSKHNKDEMGKLLDDNGLDFVSGTALIIPGSETVSGYPHIRFSVKPADVEFSKGANTKKTEVLATKISNIASDAIAKRPVAEAPNPFIENPESNIVPSTPENDKIMDALSGGKTEAKVMKPVSPEVEKTTKHIVNITKGLVPKEIGKPARLSNIENNLVSSGVDKLENIKEGKDKEGFLAMARNIINNTGESAGLVNKGYKDPEMQLSATENRTASESAKDRLRLEALDLVNAQHPIETELLFAGKDPKDPVLVKEELDNRKRSLGIFEEDMSRGDLPEELTDQWNKENAMQKLMTKKEKGETNFDAAKRRQKEIAESPFGKIFAKTGKGVATKGGTNISYGKELQSGIEKNIKEPKDDAKFGFNMALHLALPELFPNPYRKGDYGSNFTLNSLLGGESSKAKLLQESYYKTLNKEGAPFSQPKDVIITGNMSNAERKAAYKRRIDELGADGSLGSGYQEQAGRGKNMTMTPAQKEASSAESYHTVSELQSEDKNVKDLVAGEMRNPWLFAGEVGLKQDAETGARAALGIIDEWANILKDPKTGRKSIPYDKIVEKVKSVLPKEPVTVVKEQQKNLKQLLTRASEQLKGASPDSPKFIISESTSGKYTVRGASALPDLNVIILEPQLLKKKFENKAWTKPTVAGVHPLPENEFKTLSEYVDFVKNHERAHLKFDKELDMNPDYRGFSEGDKENFINEAVLGRDISPKPLAGTWADVEAYRKQRIAEESGGVSSAIKNRPDIKKIPKFEDFIKNKIDKRDSVRHEVIKEIRKDGPANGKYAYHVGSSENVESIYRDGLKSGGISGSPLLEHGYGDVVYVFNRNDVPEGTSWGDISLNKLGPKRMMPVGVFTFDELGVKTKDLHYGHRAQEVGYEQEPDFPLTKDEEKMINYHEKKTRDKIIETLKKYADQEYVMTYE